MKNNQQTRLAQCASPLHHLRSLATDEVGRDAIDRGEPWPEVNPPERRSERSTRRLLGIIDELQAGEDAP